MKLLYQSKSIGVQNEEFVSGQRIFCAKWRQQHGVLCRVGESDGSAELSFLLFGDWCFTGHFHLPLSVLLPQLRRWTTADCLLRRFLLRNYIKCRKRLVSKPLWATLNPIVHKICNYLTRILSFPDYRRDFSSDSPASAVPDKAPVTPSTTAVNSSRESSSSSTAKLIEGK